MNCRSLLAVIGLVLVSCSAETPTVQEVPSPRSKPTPSTSLGAAASPRDPTSTSSVDATAAPAELGILFVGITSNEVSGIYTMRSDGSERRLLTAATLGCCSVGEPTYRVSPDGSRLLFSTGQIQGPFGPVDGQVEVMDLDGGNRQSLASGSAAEWSPDGSQIAFVQSQADGSSGLLLMGADGGGVSALTTSAFDGAPRWSPDGATIAFLRQADDLSTDLYRVQADGGAETALVDNPAGVGIFGLDWSADGSWIGFASAPPRGMPSSRYLVRVSDGELVTIAESAEFHAPTWSPSGDLLWWGNALYAVTAGGTVTELPQGPQPIVSDVARWSPDGLRLAFSAGEPIPNSPDVQEEIYILDADGSVTKITRTADQHENLIDWVVVP